MGIFLGIGGGSVIYLDMGIGRIYTFVSEIDWLLNDKTKRQH